MDLLKALNKIYESLDSLDNAINKNVGGLDVNIQDQTTDIVDLYFYKEKDSFTLSGD